MNYRKYQNARDLAWRVLLQEKVTALPVDIVALCRKMGIRVQYYKPTDGNDGYCTIFLGRPRIFVSGECSPERQRFTIAHELGHILLGHVGRAELVNREPSGTDNPIEHDANVFASRLLAPACVLWALDARTPEQIAALCRISLQAATFRAERMELLYARNKFLISSLERQVYEQFGAFIAEKKAEAYRSSGTSGRLSR